MLWVPTGKQKLLVETPAFETLYGGGKGGGKGNYVKSLVCTPFGFVEMGTLQIGMSVSNPDGSAAKIIAVHPLGKRNLFKVNFVDGASTLVTDDHLWLARITTRELKADRRYAPFEEENRVPYKLYTTTWLREFISKNSERGERVNYPPNVLVPLTEPVQFTSPSRNRWGERWPVDPYLLGILLGDGCLRGGGLSFASADDEIVSSVRDITQLDIHSDSDCDHSINGARGLITELESIGVYGKLAQDKFIPKSYLVADVGIRRSLLQGLMDTDGTVDSRGHCSFTSVSKQLAEDVQWLARSLGYKATITQGEAGYRDEDGNYIRCRDAYDVYLQGRHTRELFRLSRKRDRCKDEFNGGVSTPHRRMVSIEPAGDGEAQCITVDNPNGLYLTDDFIVTHNSLGLLAIARNYHRRSLILRRNFTELEGSLIDESKGCFPREYYNSTQHVWEFPDGVLLRFGHAQTADDVHMYDSSQYDLVGIDQVEQFTRAMYEYFFSILRTSTQGQRVRVIATANPIGENIDWVRERWAPWVMKDHPHHAEPGEVRWYATLDNKDVALENGEPFDFRGEIIYPSSRTFIPALVADNPHINREYVSALQRLPEPFKSQLLYGRWDAGELNDPSQIILREWVDLAMARWEEANPFPKQPLSLGVDVSYGGADSTVISRCYGKWFDRLMTKMGVEVPDGRIAAQWVVQTIMNEPPKSGNVMIDMVGWGADAYGQLKDSGVPTIGLNGGSSSDQTVKAGILGFANMRTEIFWKLREALDPAYGMDMRLPPDPELKADLCAIHWEYRKDKIVIEPKEKTKERIGRSPDRADAVAYAWAMAQQSGNMLSAVIPNREYSIVDG
jgi:hypothetical protein